MKGKKHYLSKSSYIRGLQCIKSLYLYKKRYFLKDPVPPEQRAKFNRGTEVGILAQKLFPGGIDLSPRSPSQYQQAVEKTAESLRDPGVNVIYEAFFSYNRVIAGMDILARSGKKWIAYEVKSSLKISDTYKEDAALQYYLITSSGTDLEDIRILHIDPSYRMGDKLDIGRLFRSESLLEYAKGRRHFVEDSISKLLSTEDLKSSPSIPIGPQCHSPYPCDFIGHCWKKVPENSILDLSTFPVRTRFELYHEGRSLEDITTGNDQLNPIQQIQLDVHLRGEAYVDKERVNTFLDKQDDPVYFLSPILTKPAVPLYRGYKPYQEILAGYQLKKLEGTPITRLIDLNQDDPERLLAEMLKDLSAAGSIVVWDAQGMKDFFGGLKQTYPDKTNNFNDLAEIIYGLRSVLEEGSFYPHGLRGRHTLDVFAAACGSHELISAKITNGNLAGEIYRHLYLSERNIKGFSVDDIEEYLELSTNSLIAITDYLKKL